jgi:hypothetical protein
MIIEFGKDFTSFLISKEMVVFPGKYISGDIVKFQDEPCWVVESNWITYRVVKIANNPKPITYETEDMQWLW